MGTNPAISATISGFSLQISVGFQCKHQWVSVQSSVGFQCSGFSMQKISGFQYTQEPLVIIDSRVVYNSVYCFASALSERLD